MQSIINTLFSWLGTIFSKLFIVFEWALDGILFILKHFLFLVVDGLLTVVEGIFTTIDFASALPLNMFGQWELLPPQMLYILCQIGFGTILSMVVSVWGLRKLIDLIPAEFTRF